MSVSIKDPSMVPVHNLFYPIPICSLFDYPVRDSGESRLTILTRPRGALGLNSPRDLFFGHPEGFVARYERAIALPPRPRVGRARGIILSDLLSFFRRLRVSPFAPLS